MFLIDLFRRESPTDGVGCRTGEYSVYCNTERKQIDLSISSMDKLNTKKKEPNAARRALKNMVNPFLL